MNYYLERTQEKEVATIEMGESKILKAKCELEVGVVSLWNSYEPQKGEFTFTQELFSTGLQRVLRKMRGQAGGQRESLWFHKPAGGNWLLLKDRHQAPLPYVPSFLPSGS